MVVALRGPGPARMSIVAKMSKNEYVRLSRSADDEASRVLWSRLDDHGAVDAAHRPRDAGVDARAEGTLGGSGHDVALAHLLSRPHHRPGGLAGVLLEEEHDARGRRQAVLQRSLVAEPGDPELG